MQDAADGSAGTGFFLNSFSASSLVNTVRRALEIRRSDPETWKRLQRQAMAADFSWDAAASRYEQLYQQILR